MGYIEMSSESEAVLYAWLVEEVGELGRCLIRKRFDTDDHKSEVEKELGDVWNTLHAIAYKMKYTPSYVKTLASKKSEEKIGVPNEN
jgi:NTP pyrophosphatase (non-canonical NTP hydrolase)